MLSLLRKSLLMIRPCLPKTVHTSAILRIEDKKSNYKAIPADDEGTQGEKVIDLDSMITSKKSIFPDETSDNALFDGIPFSKLPICNIRVSPNNTIITLTDDVGVTKLTRSCGIEGFKNTRKGTNIAAQATAISIGSKAIDRGYRTVRVRVRGLGPGRLAAIKGLQMGGLNIVSITDSTRVSWNPPRPRKAKRL